MLKIYIAYIRICLQCASVHIHIALSYWRKYIKCLKSSFISLVFIISITVQSRGQSRAGSHLAKDSTNTEHAVHLAVKIVQI